MLGDFSFGGQGCVGSHCQAEVALIDQRYRLVQLWLLHALHAVCLCLCMHVNQTLTKRQAVGLLIMMGT
jgi:hypothetical protein